MDRQPEFRFVCVRPEQAAQLNSGALLFGALNGHYQRGDGSVDALRSLQKRKPAPRGYYYKLDTRQVPWKLT